MTAFTVRILPEACDVLAPDGSEVRLLATSSRGSMAHFKLQPGQVSVAVAHRTVEEIWYIVAGQGQMWCGYDDVEEITPLYPGVSIALPVGVKFQFRSDGDTALEAVGTTMPPWPGMDEAYAVAGNW
jgi:mannose-6-phosphate isomerase-like protein (cupin superfamily)